MTPLELPEPLPAREARLLEEVRQGRVFVEWHTVTLARGRLKIEVTEDAVKWIDGVRYAVSCQLAQQAADYLDAMLPTPLIVDAVWSLTHPSQRLGPFPQPISSSLAANRRHHDDLEAQLGPSPCGLVAGWKDWVLTQACWGPRRHAVNYGWHAAQAGATQWRGIPLHPSATPGVGSVIQPVAAAHNVLHSDYSQLLRLVRRRAYLDGVGIDLADLLTGDDAEWIAHDGPLPGHRHPAVPLAPSVTPSASGPPTEPEKPRTTTDPSLPIVDTPKPTRLGQRGPAVTEWQNFLLLMGYELPRYGADGDHGLETEAATEAWRRDQLRPDPYDGLDDEPEPSKRITLPGISFKQATHYTPGRPYGLPRVVVIHTAECAEVNQAAENLQGWASRGAGVSWHYAIDGDSITQSVREGDMAWAAGPLNDRGIHIELAGTAFQTAEQWRDTFSSAQRELLVTLLVDICQRNEIPIRKLSVEQLMMGEAGICGHDDVSAACVRARREGVQRAPWWRTDRGWRRTNHGDPGKNFPWLEVIRAAQEAA